MALTFTTGMTEIADADSLTNWSAYKITNGGATPTAILDTNVKKEGTGSVAIVPTAGKDCGMTYDYYAANANTTLNLSTSGNEVIGVWIFIFSPALIQTFANGGYYIILCGSNGIPTSSNTWAKYYVGGSDNFKEGWNFYLVDTRKTPSATNGGWTSSNLSNVYQVGIGAFDNLGQTYKAEYLYVDRMTYGRPVYTVEGDGTTVASWSDFLSDSETAANGLIADVNGALECSCGFQFGTDTQTATTTFDDDTGQIVNFKRHTYYSSAGSPSTEVDSLNYTDYYNITTKGAGSPNTTFITFGDLVGTDAGILGGTIQNPDPTNVTVGADFSTDISHISSLNLYGVNWTGINGTLKIGNSTDYKVYSNSFTSCGQVDPVGAAVIRNSLFINTSDPDASLLWVSGIDIQDSQFIANTEGAAIEIETDHGADGEEDFTKLFFSGNTYDVLNNTGSAITVNKVLGSDPSTYEGSTVTFSASLSLVFSITDENGSGTAVSGSYCSIFDESGSPPVEIMNKTSTASLSGEPSFATTSYTGGSVTGATWRVRKYGFKPYRQTIDISGSDITVNVTMVADPQQT